LSKEQEKDHPQRINNNPPGIYNLPKPVLSTGFHCSCSSKGLTFISSYSRSYVR